MPEQCEINPDHTFESRSGALKIFKDASFSGDLACPNCVEEIRDGNNPDYRIFVIEGEEYVIPLDEIDV